MDVKSNNLWRKKNSDVLSCWLAVVAVQPMEQQTASWTSVQNLHPVHVGDKQVIQTF